MFAKLTVLLLAVTATAAGLLWLRQDKMELANQIAMSHKQIDQTRQAIWERQVQVSRRVQPESLNQAVARASLSMEPIIPMPASPDDFKTGSVRVAQGQKTKPASNRNRGR